MLLSNRKILSMNGRLMNFVMAAMLLLPVSGCQQKDKDTRPEGLLPEDKVISVLREVYLVEARVAALAIPYDSSQKIFNLAEEGILEKHNVDPEVYKASMKYYFEHPDELSYIYEAAVDSLSLLERKLIRENNSGDQRN